jgi:hypothetical protein
MRTSPVFALLASVATVGKPYPIRITGTPGAVAADIHFEAWNEPVRVRAPAGAAWWDSIP